MVKKKEEVPLMKEGVVDITFKDGSKFDRNKKYKGIVIKAFDEVTKDTPCSVEAMYTGELIIYCKVNNKSYFKIDCKEGVDFNFV